MPLSTASGTARPASVNTAGRFGREDAGMSWLRAGSRRRKPEMT